MIRKVLWNNGVSTAGSLSYAYTRGDASVNDYGQTLTSSQPRYSAYKLLCPAPILTHRRSDVLIDRVWGGRWIDGTPCMLELWQSAISTNHFFTSIAVNANPGSATREVDLGAIADLHVESGWIHAPTSFVIADGLILAICVASTTAPQIRSVSVCYWDENVAGGGTQSWQPHATGADAQLGHARGGAWMATGPWIPPDGIDAATGAIVKFFAAWVDYRANGLLIPANTLDA